MAIPCVRGRFRFCMYGELEGAAAAPSAPEAVQAVASGNVVAKGGRIGPPMSGFRFARMSTPRAG